MKLGVPQPTLNKILKNRDVIEASCSNTDGRKRQRSGHFPEIDSAIIKWIQASRDKCAMLSGSLIEAKADEFAAQLGFPYFKANDGWLGRLKKREGLVYKKLHGEGKSADIPSRDKWLDEIWPRLMENYDPDQIWNADETGLYFRALPDGTITFKNDFAKGGKRSKERITAMLACSMVGEKKRILVIGKSKSPRCFRGASLPVDYEANKSAWMTSAIFSNWLRAWDKELCLAKKKILLLVDNCAAHPEVEELTNIRLEFFPPNTTSVLQPCDQGVINAVKAHYRRRICQQTLDCLEEENRAMAMDLAKKTTLLEAILMLNAAWSDLSALSIINCWKKCELTLRAAEAEGADEEEEEDVAATEVFLQPEWNIDADLPICHASTDEDIISEVRQEFGMDRELQNEEEDDDDDDPEEVPPSIPEARKALATLRKALLLRGFSRHSLLTEFEAAVDKTLDQNLTQTKLDRYFMVLSNKQA